MIALALVLLAGVPATTTTIVTVERRTIIRIPARRRRGPPPPPPPAFREKRGPHCLYSTDIAGAAVSGPSQVDFVLHGGERVRAELEAECPALDFYGGFYLSPAADGKICADRDAIRTRAGGECAIDRFRRLVPQSPPPPPR